MDELLELMDHHTQQAITGVTMSTTFYAARFENIAAQAMERIKQCVSK